MNISRRQRLKNLTYSRQESRAKKIMARALKANGYSTRQIMALVGWRSPRSVTLATQK